MRDNFFEFIPFPFLLIDFFTASKQKTEKMRRFYTFEFPTSYNNLSNLYFFNERYFSI